MKHQTPGSAIRRPGIRPLSLSGSGEARGRVARIRRRRTRRLPPIATEGRLLPGALVLALALALSPAAAHGAFPGRNGPLVIGLEYFARDIEADVFAVGSITPDGRPGGVGLPSCSTRDDCLSFSDPVLSPDGGRLAFGLGDGIGVAAADGSGLRQLAGLPDRAGSPAWSPDGREIVFAARGSGSGKSDLFVAPVDGGAVRRLTDTPGVGEGAPTWGTRPAADGGLIAYVRGHRIWTMRPDGERVRRITARGGFDPSFSPHASRIAFVRRGQVYTVGARGGGLDRVTNRGGVSPSWSPDGRRIAFLRFSGRAGIYQMGPQGRRAEAHPAPGRRLRLRLLLRELARLGAATLSVSDLAVASGSGLRGPSGSKVEAPSGSRVGAERARPRRLRHGQPRRQERLRRVRSQRRGGGLRPRRGREAHPEAGHGGCISESGSAGLCAVGRALEGAESVAVSPDGSSVYVASGISGAVAVFDREAQPPSPPPPIVPPPTPIPGGMVVPCASGTTASVRCFVAAPGAGDEFVAAARGLCEGVGLPSRATVYNRVILGGAADERIVGTSADDVIVSGGGEDDVNARAGEDCVVGGDGDDDLDGGNGGDLVAGGDGDDEVDAGDGADRVVGGVGRDRLSGGRGGDRVAGNAGNDRVRGGPGRDRLAGGAGSDRLIGGSGNDRLIGGGGRDRLSGQRGRDRLVGGSGRDRLVGGSGGDRIRGVRGRDVFSGGSGRDRIDARGQRRERVGCGSGFDRVRTKRRERDRIRRDCERVRRFG